jgi:hypothetical protein
LEQFGLQKCLFGSAKMRYFRQTFFLRAQFPVRRDVFDIHAQSCTYMLVYAHIYRRMHPYTHTETDTHLYIQTCTSMRTCTIHHEWYIIYTSIHI